MKKIVMGLVCFFGLSRAVFAVDFAVNLSELNTDFYEFNGFSGSIPGGVVNLTMNLTQENGKLFAYGDVNVASQTAFGYVDLDAKYTVKGTLSTYRDTLRLKLAYVVKGKADIEGDIMRFSVNLNQDVVLNENTGEMSGTLKGRASLAGMGSQPFNQPITLDAPPGYGFGSTDLDLSIDGDKKLIGSGIITLPSGETVEFISTASFNGKTLQYKIQLKGDKDDAFSRGSKLTLTIVDDTVTAMSGTVLGQKASYKAPKK